MKINEQYLIETNEQLLQRHKKRTGESVYIEVIQKNMDEVISMISKVGNSGDKEQEILEIATHILSVIALKQPFMDGNRRTGIIAAGKFLRDNGYELDIDPEEDNLELRGLLRKIKLQLMTLNQEAMEQLSFYISKRIKKYEPRR
jgi:prophage maintenance system killer protein